MTPGTIHKYRAKISKNVSEFTHSNCITLSYYSSPKHKESASINTSLTSVHSNLEHGLAILTESFSLTQPLVEVQSRSDVASHAIHF